MLKFFKTCRLKRIQLERRNWVLERGTITDLSRCKIPRQIIMIKDRILLVESRLRFRYKLGICELTELRRITGFDLDSSFNEIRCEPMRLSCKL